KGLLPSTGGAGIYAFIIIGAAMMIGAYIWFKKSRQQAEV
ncbi:LPXTG cell wall anchor domain-containing protein, partial [Lactococcus cremoris]